MEWDTRRQILKWCHCGIMPLKPRQENVFLSSWEVARVWIFPKPKAEIFNILKKWNMEKLNACQKNFLFAVWKHSMSHLNWGGGKKLISAHSLNHWNMILHLSKYKICPLGPHSLSQATAEFGEIVKYSPSYSFWLLPKTCNLKVPKKSQKTQS